MALQVPLQETGKVGTDGVADAQATTNATTSTNSFVDMVRDKSVGRGGIKAKHTFAARS